MTTLPGKMSPESSGSTHKAKKPPGTGKAGHPVGTRNGRGGRSAARKPGTTRTVGEAAPEKVSHSLLDDSMLRVVLLLDVEDGAQHRFLEAYDQLSNRVAEVPGHISDQLCQSIENPSQWLITSEWESALPFVAWVESASHRTMVEPLHGCVRDTRSLRFSIMRETTTPGSSRSGRFLAVPRIGDGIVRHAITYTVKSGSERAVADILANYTAPRTRVNGTTQLYRTSLFMHGNRVVRAVEVRGDLVSALRHIAAQPEIRAVEEAINPHLEEERHLADPESARTFFACAALPAVHHVAFREIPATGIRRHAVLYPARPGSGQTAARLLARHDEAALDDPESPLVSSTLFQRDDILVRMMDLRVPLEREPLLALGVGDRRGAAVLSRFLDLGVGPRLTDSQGPERFLHDYAMELVTDRRTSGS